MSNTNHQKGLTKEDCEVIAHVLTSVWDAGGTMSKKEYRAFQRICAYGRKL